MPAPRDRPAARPKGRGPRAGRRADLTSPFADPEYDAWAGWPAGRDAAVYPIPGPRDAGPVRPRVSVPRGDRAGGTLGHHRALVGVTFGAQR